MSSLKERSWMGILTPEPRIQGTQGLTIHRVNKGIIKVCCFCCNSQLVNPFLCNQL